MTARSTVSLVLSGEDQSASSVLSSVAGSVGGVGTALAGLAVGGAALAAGAMVTVGVSAFNMSQDIHQATNDIQTQLGLTRDAATELSDVAVDVFSNGFGNSMGEAADAVVAVRQNIDRFGELSSQELQQATETAFGLRDAFDIDVGESANAAAALMQNFGLTSDEAFGFVTAGLQAGLNNSGDFLDTIGEYSVQFADGGATAAEFFSVMDTGLQSGMLGVDKAGDIFKEFRLRIQDGSDSTSNALAAIGLSVDDIMAGLDDGSLTVMDAFNMVSSGIRMADSDTTAFNAGVALMGSQFEDLGQSAVAAIDPLALTMEDISQSTGDLNVQYDNLGGALEVMKRKALVALTPLSDVALNLINDNLPALNAAFDIFEGKLSTIATLLGDGDFSGAMTELFGAEAGAAITSFAETIGGFVNGTLIPFVQTHSEEFKGAITAIGVVLAGAGIIGGVVAVGAAIAALANPITLIVAGVAVLGAAWAGNWGGIQEKTQTAVEFVRTTIDAGVTVVNELWQTHGDRITEIANTAWETIQGAIESGTEAINSVLTAFKAAAEGDWFAFGENLREGADSAWEAITGVFTAAKGAVVAVVGDIVSGISERWNINNWGDLGNAVVNGIKGGISAGRDAVIGVVMDIARGAVDAIKGFFGISSPSRLMRDMFRDDIMGAGVLGMKEKLPEMIRTTEDIMGQVGDTVQTGVRPLDALIARRLGTGDSGFRAPPFPTSQSPTFGQSGRGDAPIHIEKIEINDRQAMLLLLDFIQRKGSLDALQGFVT